MGRRIQTPLVQLVGTSNTSSSHYVSGFYRFNVN